MSEYIYERHVKAMLVAYLCMIAIFYKVPGFSRIPLPRKPSGLEPGIVVFVTSSCPLINPHDITHYIYIWVRGLMAINVECEFRDRGSIPSMCQITEADLGQVG